MMLRLKRGSNFNGVQPLNLIHGFQRLLLYSTSSSSATEASPSSSSSLANYLVEALGFSTQQSLSTSTKLFKLRKSSSTLMNVSDERKLIVDVSLVIDFFKKNGFDEPQIGKLITRLPRIALSNVDKTLKPKFELFREIGFSGSDLYKTIILCPSLLGLHLNPVIQSLRQVLGSDENVRKDVSSSCIYFRHGGLWSYHKHLVSNVELLKNCGIPNDIILKYVMQDPVSFTIRPPNFEDGLIKVQQKLGISPTSSMFLYVFRKLRRLSEKNIEGKFQVFKSFGWTRSDFLELMGKVPSSLGHSKAMTKKKLGFLMKELGYRPADLISRNALMTCSLEKRILPRHQVLLVLKEKGLIEKNLSLYTTIVLNESKFVYRFVLPYAEVHEVYANYAGANAKLLTQGRADAHSSM